MRTPLAWGGALGGLGFSGEALTAHGDGRTAPFWDRGPPIPDVTGGRGPVGRDGGGRSRAGWARPGWAVGGVCEGSCRVPARPSQRRRFRGGGVSPAVAGLWACPFPASRGDPPVASPLRGLPHSPSAQGKPAVLQVARGASTRVLGGVGRGKLPRLRSHFVPWWSFPKGGREHLGGRGMPHVGGGKESCGGRGSRTRPSTLGDPRHRGGDAGGGLTELSLCTFYF